MNKESSIVLKKTTSCHSLIFVWGLILVVKQIEPNNKIWKFMNMAWWGVANIHF